MVSCRNWKIWRKRRSWRNEPGSTTLMMTARTRRCRRSVFWPSKSARRSSSSWWRPERRTCTGHACPGPLPRCEELNAHRATPSLFDLRTTYLSFVTWALLKFPCVWCVQFDKKKLEKQMGDLGLEMQGNDNVSPPSAVDFIVHQRGAAECFNHVSVIVSSEPLRTAGPAVPKCCQEAEAWTFSSSDVQSPQPERLPASARQVWFTWCKGTRPSHLTGSDPANNWHFQVWRDFFVFQMARKAKTIMKNSQKGMNRQGKKGEADRHVFDLKPKHLLAGKRKSGTNSHR